MKRKITIFVCLMVSMAVLFAGGSSESSSGEKNITLRFTSVSVTGDSHTTAMTAFADKVAELSGGTVKCLTYADGTLFSSENEFDAILSGDADLAYISFPTLATQKGLEWMAMLGSGYFWSSYEHMTNTMNGEVGKTEVFDKVSDAINLIPLSGFYLGARVVNTRDRRIDNYADMKGLLLRMPNSETWLNLGSALGANPTPLSFSELYTALQTGTIDAQENPLPTDVSAKFYEVTKYVAITNHVIDCILPCINKDTWNSMSEAQQQAVMEAMEYARQVNDSLRLEEEAKDIEILEANGIIVTYPDIAEFKENVTAYYNSHPEQIAKWDMDLYAKLQATAN